MGIFDFFTGNRQPKTTDNSPPIVETPKFDFFSDSQDYDVEEVYKYFKDSIEWSSVVNTLVSDILTEVELDEDTLKSVASLSESPDEDKNIRKGFYDFLSTSGFYLAFKQALIDLMLFGRALVFVKSVKTASKYAGKNKRKLIFNQGKFYVLNQKYWKVKYDERGNIQKIVYDNGGNIKQAYDPEQVIILEATREPNKMKPFSPANAIVPIVHTINAARNSLFLLSKQPQDPSFIILRNAVPGNDSNYENIKRLLQELKNKEMRFALLTGDVDIVQLNSVRSIEAHIRTIEHNAALIYRYYGVPNSRLLPPSDMRVQIRELNENYFKTVDAWQRLIEEQLNTQFFMKHLGLKIRFSREYLIDQLRQANIVAILADRNIATVEELRDLMGFSREWNKNETFPIKMKFQLATMYNEIKDNKISQGDDENLMPNAPKKPDNKLRG